MVYSGWEKISPTEAFGDETGFNNWLHKEGLKLLDQELHLGITPISREYNIGAFRSDLLVELLNKQKVIIESQFGESNHIHLGELLTYFGLNNVDKGIWICEGPRREHVDALIKLNKRIGGQTFYLVSFQVGRVADQLVVQFQKQVPKALRSNEARPVDGKQETYWTELLSKAIKVSPKFKNINPWKYWGGYISTGLTGIVYFMSLNKHETSIGIYMDLGKYQIDLNTKRYEHLRSRKSLIEEHMGKAMEWRWTPPQSTMTIKYIVDDKLGYQDVESWSNIQDRSLEEFLKLESIVDPIIKELKEVL